MLTVTKSVILLKTITAPYMPLRGKKSKTVFLPEMPTIFGNGLRLDFVMGVYNHGSLIVKNGMSFELLIFDDFRGYVIFLPMSAG